MVQFPAMRRALIRSLEYLADEDYQWWALDAAQHDAPVYQLDLAYHTVFDDSALEDNPTRTIGSVLENTAEADAMGSVMSLLLLVQSEVADGAPDRDFLQAPSWPRVVDAARAALRVFRR